MCPLDAPTSAGVSSMGRPLTPRARDLLADDDDDDDDDATEDDIPESCGNVSTVLVLVLVLVGTPTTPWAA